MEYKAKALVLSCIDFRFQKMIEDFIEKDLNYIQSYDRVAVAGAIKQLVHPAKPEYKEYLLQQINISVSLHDPHTIILINHEDCGAYGSDNDRSTHEKDLQDAYILLKGIYKEREIKLYMATFKGLESVKPISQMHQKHAVHISASRS